MAHDFQDILIERLDIKLPGVSVRRLALHQHMNQVEKVKAHSHPYQQLLLYLRGRGVQRVEAKRIPVRRGTLISVCPRQDHEFIKEREVRPVCLAIDLKSADFAKLYTSIELGSDATRQIEQALYRLGRLHLLAYDTPLAVAAEVLTILATMQLCGRGSSRSEDARIHPMTDRIRCLITEGNLAELSPAGVAKLRGKSIDHLNRQLKRESGETIGQLLASARLERACELLKDGALSIGEVAATVGYLDQNYFARWFRQQTGQTPSDWRCDMVRSAKLVETCFGD